VSLQLRFELLARVFAHMVRIHGPIPNPNACVCDIAIRGRAKQNTFRSQNTGRFANKLFIVRNMFYCFKADKNVVRLIRNRQMQRIAYLKGNCGVGMASIRFLNRFHRGVKSVNA